MRISFVLICEGSSDSGLIPHLETLCIEAGADEARGIAPDPARLPRTVGRTVQNKIDALKQWEPDANLFFIHRDADGPDASPRHQEIRDAVARCGLDTQYCAVVPVQETEAWLLLDEAAIRKVAGRPAGRARLSLPSAAAVERVADPKELLKASLAAASELSGRRLERFRKDFSRHRRLLLQRLPVEGPITRVPAWQAMRTAIRGAVADLNGVEGGHAV